MNTLQRLIAGIILIFLVSSCQKGIETWTLNSPGNTIKVVVNRQEGENQKLEYRVFYVKDGQDIVALEPSPLGIDREDSQFTSNLAFTGKSEKDIDENYTMVSGSRLKNRNHAREMTLSFKNPDGKPVDMIFRAYDEGFAFRYHFPDTVGGSYKIADELSGFNLPEDGQAWMQAYDSIAPWSPGYEQFYQNGIPIGTPSPENKNGWAFPALFHTNNLWILIAEADLDSSWCGMHLNDNPTDGLYTLRFPEYNEAYDTTGQKPVSTLPWTSPWRFGIIADNAGTVVQSNLVNDLSRPSVISDVSWIKPGRASWSWWSSGSTPRDFNRLKKYVDMSAEYGWEYSLVDAGWDNMQNGTIEDLAKYAESKNVGLLIWYNSGGPNNVVTASPRDRMYDPAIRKKEFAWMKKTGVKGVKVDFFQSDKQKVIKLYLDILKDAADAGIVVNFHGCTMPRGWSRTYPNLLSMEAVRGAESYRFDKNYPAYAAVHNTIIPFTRNVMGPVDFTPVTFSDVNYPHITSNAHELALSVVFQSGILHLADNYKVYPEQPGYVIDFLKNLPVTWDETRLVDGTPGNMVIIARRKGDNWYVAGINGTDKSMTVKPDLSFTGSSKKMLLITDGDSDRSFTFSEVSSANELPEITMLPRGGFVVYTK